MTGCQMVKTFDEFCFDTAMACDKRTDKQTDILPQHSPFHASSDNNFT